MLYFYYNLLPAFERKEISYMAKSTHFNDQLKKELHHQMFENISHSSITSVQFVQLKNGDENCIESLYQDFCSNKSNLSSNPVQSKRYLLVSALTLITRYAISSGANKEEMYVSSDLYIQVCDSCTTCSEVEALFLEILKFYVGKIRSALASRYSSPVCHAINYITARLYEPVNIQELCCSVGYSQSYLSNLFKKETGLSLLQFVHKLKIDQACNLLFTTSLSLSEISSLLAYSSLSHFVHTFHKIMNVTPQVYRNSIALQQLQP